MKHLLTKSAQPAAPAPVVPISQPVPPPQIAPASPQMQAPAQAQNPAATLSNIFNAPPRANGNGSGNGNGNGNGQRFGTPAAPVAVAAPTLQFYVPHAPSRIATSGVDVAKLRIEILRLEHLVKKLQSEIEAEREYAHALEEHIKTLQETE